MISADNTYTHNKMHKTDCDSQKNFQNESKISKLMICSAHRKQHDKKTPLIQSYLKESQYKLFDVQDFCFEYESK